MEEVSLIVKPDMDSKGQELSIRLKDIDHHAVYGDAVRVKQILINLLSNAVKYTSDRGHIAVSLEEKLSSESGVGCFEFVVEDDGIGMPRNSWKSCSCPLNGLRIPGSARSRERDWGWP